jgi:hypothetical protein
MKWEGQDLNGGRNGGIVAFGGIGVWSSKDTGTRCNGNGELNVFDSKGTGNTQQ